jgi:hypothetical protein
LRNKICVHFVAVKAFVAVGQAKPFVTIWQEEEFYGLTRKERRRTVENMLEMGEFSIQSRPVNNPLSSYR